MSTSTNKPSVTLAVDQLIKNQQQLKDHVAKSFDHLEKEGEAVEKKIIELEDIVRSQQKELDLLQSKCEAQESEITRLKEVKLELLDGLDDAISRLTKRRRLVAYTLDSPQSPTRY